MIKKYKGPIRTFKIIKPEFVEAIQLTQESFEDCLKFIGEEKIVYQNPIYIEIVLKSAHGNLLIVNNDFIIKGFKGEFKACKPDIFKEAFEEL